MSAINRLRGRRPFPSRSFPLAPRSLLLASLAGLALAACSGEGDIDRTQPDKVEKSIFLNADGSPRTFYYRKTTVGAPPTSAYAFEGIMGELMKVKFDIREKLLVAYRAYDYAAGSQNPTTGGDNNQDTPMLMFAITSQFDVKREYNPGTGEQTNVISENTTDRPWNKRQYMRVDWSKNLTDPPADGMAMDPMNPFFPATTLPTGFSVGEGDLALVNPDRPVVTHDYIDFANKEIRTPDYNACMTLFDTFDDGGPWGCGAAEITYRNSLLPVPEGPSQYEPLLYPDRQPILGADGKPIRYAFDPTPVAGFLGGRLVNCTPANLQAAGLSGDDCTTASMDQFAKFGFFRTVRPTYDRKTGSTEEGREYFINRWNVWTDTVQRDIAGKPVMNPDGTYKRTSIADRLKQGQTRKITYYMNPEFPADKKLRDMAATVIGDWNQAMKETIAGMKLAEENQNAQRTMASIRTAAADIPDIFELKPNSCELDSVNKFMTDHPDITRLVQSKVKSSTLDFDNLTQADLVKACSALSAVTENRPEGDAKKFVWQRNGDLRYSFLYWVDRPQPAGPLGYGPSSQDPETGEIISASAYIYGASLDTYAQYAVDSIRLANGSLDPDDLLSGKTISDVLAQTRAASQARMSKPVTKEAMAAAQAKIRSQGKTQAARLVKVAPGIDDQTIARIRGTTLQKMLVNDDILPGLIPGYRPGDTPPADAFDRAMGQPWFSSEAREARKTRFQTLAQHGCLYMAEFADDAILGTALELDQMQLPPAEMFAELRSRIFRGLADHEVGHTMGLRHNFSSSTDALNYDDKYWKIRASMPKEQWEANKLSEYAYASVMDYGSRFNSDIQGLGRYDTAAIRFGYGQLIDTIPKSMESADSGLRNDILFFDYSHIPWLTSGVEGDTSAMDDAATAVVSFQASIDAWQDGFRNLSQNGGGFGILAERPYKFCSDEFEGNFDCKTWDRGANQREIIDNTTQMFRNYYVFNAYKRGRTTWQIDNYLNRIESRYFNRYGEAFQFFYFFGDMVAGSDFGDDLLGASMDALNALGAVLQTPEPGLHCTTAYSGGVMISPNNSTDCDQGSRAALNLPDAKPFFINFSDDYYYRITRAGSLYEKMEALFMLTSTESRFFRVDTFADSNRYSINYYRVFKDEMIKLLSGVIRNDPTGYGATIDPVTKEYSATPVVDPDTYGQLNPKVPSYMAQPRLETPVNKTIRYWALLLSLARLGSTWDATLDFNNYLAVAAKGADDDFTFGASVPVKEFTHPTSGIIYRAPSYPVASGPNNIGADLIDELTNLVGTSGVTGTIDKKFGTYTNGNALPNWYSAKAALAAASSQAAYDNALATFTFIDQLVAYRVDLIGDIRLFRKQMMLLNGVLQ